jgi:transcription antitermination factor NusG
MNPVMTHKTSEKIGSTDPLEWNAVYTRHQHEKIVAESLTRNGFETFLPTYDTIRRWTDRRKRLSLPLFPSYVFVRSNFERRFRLITTPGVHSVVMFGGKPAVISGVEVDAIRKAVDSRLGVEPHPFLQCGDWVRVTSGPLTDVEGILVRRKSSYRLILSAQLLGKSMSVEIDGFSVKPVPRRSANVLRSLNQRELLADRRVAG